MLAARASYGVDDKSLGIQFTQVKSRDATLHVQITAMKPELQQKFPLLVRPASIPHALRRDARSRRRETQYAARAVPVCRGTGSSCTK
jgi:hypothetical protein